MTPIDYIFLTGFSFTFSATGSDTGYLIMLVAFIVKVVTTVSKEFKEWKAQKNNGESQSDNLAS